MRSTAFSAGVRSRRRLVTAGLAVASNAAPSAKVGTGEPGPDVPPREGGQGSQDYERQVAMLTDAGVIVAPSNADAAAVAAMIIGHGC